MGGYADGMIVKFVSNCFERLYDDFMQVLEAGFFGFEHAQLVGCSSSDVMWVCQTVPQISSPGPSIPDKVRGKHLVVYPGQRKKVATGRSNGRRGNVFRGGWLCVANRSALVVFALPICHSRPCQEHV